MDAELDGASSERNAYVSMDPSVDKMKINAAGTNGYFGEIDTNSNEAIYQQTNHGVSDIYLVDVSGPSTRAPAPDVNTG